MEKINKQTGFSFHSLFLIMSACFFICHKRNKLLLHVPFGHYCSYRCHVLIIMWIVSFMLAFPRSFLSPSLSLSLCHFHSIFPRHMLCFFSRPFSHFTHSFIHTFSLFCCHLCFTIYFCYSCKTISTKKSHFHSIFSRNVVFIFKILYNVSAQAQPYVKWSNRFSCELLQYTFFFLKKWAYNIVSVQVNSLLCYQVTLELCIECVELQH